MGSTRTDKYWTRLKTSIGAPIGLFFLYIFVYIIQVPSGVEDADFTFSTYPIITTILYLFLIASLVGVPLYWHSLYRDKQELAKDYPDVNQRHWVTIGVFSYFSSGIYGLWYLVARYRKTKDETDELSAAGSTTTVGESTPTNEGTTTVSNGAGTVESAASANDTMTTASDSESTDSEQQSEVERGLTRGDELWETATTQLNADGYDQALETFADAKEAYSNALESAKPSEDTDTDEILSKLTAVEDKQEDVHRQRIQPDVESLRSQLETAERLASDGRLKDAKRKLTGLEGELTSVAEEATKHDVEGVRDQLETLRNRREQQLADVTERLQQHRIPNAIPRAPTISVEYDELENKEPIGGGGNADVTKATLPTPDGDVTLAIKEPRMSGTLHTDAIDRLLQEAETWDKLDTHDHIVGVIDYGSAPIPWIAMEYMDAGHLGDRGGDLGIPQALWTAIGVTKGVRHAHRRGVAHLDLKPANVLFRAVDDSWDVPKVADWGLSKHLLDHSKSVEGLSPQYAAPEQFDEDFGATDDITDIYQLGAVFYELFTGQPSVEGKPAKAMHKVLNEDPTPPSEIADVPDELDDILLTALSKEKADRYDDIVYLRDDLQAVFDKW